MSTHESETPKSRVPGAGATGRRPQTVFMFSGQGSHYYQMGRGLFDENRTYRDCFLELDGIARRLVGTSVADVLYDPARRKSDAFDDLEITSLAIFMVEYALAQTLRTLGVVPDYVLGVSMGTYAAATVAGCLDPDLALRILVEQARALRERCYPGGMTAILSDSVDRHDAIFRPAEIVAFNAPHHFVVAAREEDLRKVECELRARGATHQRLNVRYPFHTRWIDEARTPFVSFLRTLSFKPAKTPIACCARGALVWDLAPDYFWEVARKPIEFRQTLATLERAGTFTYVDVGPSGSLATLAKNAIPPGSASEALATLTAFGRDVERLRVFAGRRPTAAEALA